MTGHRGGWMVDWRSGSSIVSPFILPPPPPINHCTASCCLCSKGFGRIPPDHFSACPHDTHCLSSPPPINFTARFLSFAAETHSHSRAIHTGASQTYFQYLNRKIAAIVFCRKHIQFCIIFLWSLTKQASQIFFGKSPNLQTVVKKLLDGMRSARASSKNSKLSFCHPWLLVAESFC